MGPLERRLRRAVNSVSTAWTEWWCGLGARRQVSRRPAFSGRGMVPGGRARAFFGVASPGEWVAPAGLRPGWQWLPEYGATPNLPAVPRWVRIWYRTPFLDRYAYEWMWWHGGWSVLTPGEPPAPPPAGVREPRRPRPYDRSGVAEYGEPVSRTVHPDTR